MPLATTLVEQGHDVTVVSCYGEKIPGVKVVIHNPSFIKYWSFSIPLALWVKSNIRKYDAVHIHGIWNFPQLIACYYADKYRIKHYITPHGVFVEPKRYSSFRKRVYRWVFVNRMIRKCSAIHITSDLELHGGRNAGIRKRSVLIPWGLPRMNVVDKVSESFHSSLPSLGERQIILFLSRISSEKGLENLFYAMQENLDSLENWLLVIAGAEDRQSGYIKHLEALLKSLGLGSYVQFVGLVSGDLKASLLLRASLFILPSFGENFGFSVAEALSYGLPVITTNRTPWKKIQEVGAGYVVDPNISELSHALKSALALTKSERTDMGLRAKALITNEYDWSDLVRRYINELYSVDV